MARTASKPARQLVVDSSAILAILFQEPGWEPVLETIESSESAFATAPNLVGNSGHFHDFLRSVGIEVLPFTNDYFRAALKAFDQYGKGRHPASLNFGDCLAYAAASLTKLPLLFVGDDFTKTDIVTALR